MKHQVSDNPAEDRVAKKLEPLVAVLIVGLGNPGTMAHCPPKQFGVTKCVTQALLKSRQGQGSTACALVDVVNSVADRLEILKVLVFDSEPVGAIRQLLLNRLDEFDQRQRVGVEVIDKRLPLANRRWIDLQNVGESVTNDLEDLVSLNRSVIDWSLGRHERDATRLTAAQDSESGGRIAAAIWPTMSASTISFATVIAFTIAR